MRTIRLPARAPVAAVLLALTATLACGAAPGPPRPALPDGEGRFTLRYNRPPPLTGNPDLYFEVQGPTGWERVSLENPDEEQDLLTPLVALAEANPPVLIEVDAGFRRDTRAYGDHTARVVRLYAVPGLQPVAPAPPSAADAADEADDE